ncbi:MAG: DEAD/DEAH box helicase [Euryarchaeota archaeon]|nr:DEAD/DEAH box helicase [Euryarchaeota archaeon]
MSHATTPAPAWGGEGPAPPSLAVSIDTESIFAEGAKFERTARQRLKVQAELLDTVEPKSALVSVNQFKDRIQLYTHQTNAALRVLTKMGGRAILADEVGLGKTIEAGIAMKELITRGLVESVLILTPASLVGQWRGELGEKFGEAFLTHEDAEFKGFDQHPRIIASIDTAKLEDYAAQITGRTWDLLVVDEAHYLKSRSTLRYDLVSKIEARYFLALTATPIQNNLRELYNLIHLVRPGLLGSAHVFDRRFLADAEGRRLQNVSELQERLREVIIRNRRKETGLEFPARHVKTYSQLGSEREYELHDSIADFIKKQYDTQGFLLTLLLLQREMTSSPHAVADTLRRIQRSGDVVAGPELDELVKLAEGLRKSTKAELIAKIAKKLGTHFILYTQFRRTQELLLARLKKMGINAIPFHGEMTSGRRQAALAEFKKDGGALIATDSGSEGLNLQFCHVIVNYDLPWNPMRVEQRIGRVHRIGQKEDVVIINLALKDTVEDYVLKILYEKIRLFEVAIGEMDLILSEVESGESLEAQIFEVLAKAKNRSQQKRRLAKLREKLEVSVEKAETIKKFDAEVFNQFDLGTVEGA